MTDTRKISLCLTNYNRYQMLIESFEKVLSDNRIGEVIVSDDCSEYGTYKKLRQYFSDKPKVKLSRTDNNIGCYKNKRHAISLASNEYVIIFDSDNVLDEDYIDKVYSLSWSKDILFAPDFAKPHFDYRSFSGEIITRQNARSFADRKHFTALINTMNYFVNKDEYLKVWDSSIGEPWTADTLFQNYNWLKAGNKIHVLKGLEYIHKIEHKEHKSHYQEHNRKTGRLFEQTMDNLRQLR